MDCKEDRSYSNGASKRRKKSIGYWTAFACFRGSPNMSDDEATMRTRAKSLAVVPVETSGGDSDQRSTNGDAIVGKKGRKKEMNRRRSFMDKSKGPNALAKLQATQEITTVYHVSSNLKTQIEPAPLYQMIDPVQTETQTHMSHSGSPEPTSPSTLRKVYADERSKKNGYGPSMGLCVLTIALALMVLGGLTLGVICMRGWFSVLYMLRSGRIPEKDGTSENKLEEVYVNSEEYKRMVVFRGFLERDKRKSSMETKREGV